jgi:uncharacterized protein YoxC
MSNFFLGLIILAIVVAVIIFIWVMLELRKAIRALKELVNTTENSLKPTVAELQETLKSVKVLADSTMEITEDMKIFSGALKDAGKSVKHVSGDVERVVNLVEGITSLASLETSSLKAGIKAGLWVLSKSLFKKN